MTEEQKPQEESIELDAQTVAAAALVSEQSWEILAHLYGEVSRLILLTQGFIGPVNQNRDVLKERLTDFIGFDKSFNTLLSDIRSIGTRLNNIYEKHKGRVGTPTEDEWVEVFAYSQAYSDLQDEYQTVIVPLIISLTEMINTAIPELMYSPTTQQ